MQDIVAIAFSPSGKLAISGGADKTVRLWDPNTGMQIANTPGSGSYISSVAFSADEKLALFGTDDGTVTLWGLE